MVFFLTQLTFQSITALYSLAGVLSGTTCAIATIFTRGFRKDADLTKHPSPPRAALVNILILSDDEITAASVAKRIAGEMAYQERSVLPGSPDFLVCKMPLCDNVKGSEEHVTCCLWHLGGLSGGLGGDGVHKLGAEFLSIPDATMIVLEISKFSKKSYTENVLEYLFNCLSMVIGASPSGAGGAPVEGVEAEDEEQNITMALFLLGDSSAAGDEALQQVLEWSADMEIKVYATGELGNSNKDIMAAFTSFLRQQGLLRKPQAGRRREKIHSVEL